MVKWIHFSKTQNYLFLFKNEWQKRRKRLKYLHIIKIPLCWFQNSRLWCFWDLWGIHWIYTEGVSVLSDPRSSQAAARVVFDQLCPSGHANGSCVQIMCTVDMCTQVYRSCELYRPFTQTVSAELWDIQRYKHCERNWPNLSQLVCERNSKYWKWTSGLQWGHLPKGVFC